MPQLSGLESVCVVSLESGALWAKERSAERRENLVNKKRSERTIFLNDMIAYDKLNACKY